jgi:hypothetical protein
MFCSVAGYAEFDFFFFLSIIPQRSLQALGYFMPRVPRCSPATRIIVAQMPRAEGHGDGHQGTRLGRRPAAA